MSGAIFAAALSFATASQTLYDVPFSLRLCAARYGVDVPARVSEAWLRRAWSTPLVRMVAQGPCRVPAHAFFSTLAR